MIIRCHICHADPAGRWKQPPAIIFIDEPPGCIARDPSHYRCRDHLSPRREEEIRVREQARGFEKGALR
jgi:hypothetical protein